jgi:hypothetical protein
MEMKKQMNSPNLAQRSQTQSARLQAYRQRKQRSNQPPQKNGMNNGKNTRVVDKQRFFSLT